MGQLFVITLKPIWFKNLGAVRASKILLKKILGGTENFGTTPTERGAWNL
jgi:hypothetical protein